MKKYHRALTAILLASAASLSLAHGDDPKSHKTAAATKQQKEWGIAGDAKSVTRTVTLTMDDNMRFTPDKLSFKQGETIRFVIRNKGKLLHELVIGTQKELDEHAAMMLKFPAMEHDEPYMAHVRAGKTGGLIWTFNRPGEFDFACLIAGHYQAGMVGKISVAAASR
ncbi:cupredoxin family protein [Polaromonas sp.]|uniref:cupredoxin domain-containing protein n=1 Tax=Polaromonas sp. TaxID=1869339 RepID=UPI003267D8BD